MSPESIPDNTSPPEDSERESEGRRSSAWWWAGGLAIVLATGPYVWLNARRPALPAPAAVKDAPAAPQLGLTAAREPGDWKLTWNRDAVAGLDPIGAMLTIRDGAAVRTQFLQAADLGSGFVLYVPQSSDLTFTLKVTGAKGEMEERVRVLGAAPSTATMRVEGGSPEPEKAASTPRAPAKTPSSPPRIPAARSGSAWRNAPARNSLEASVPPAASAVAQSDPNPTRMIAAAWPPGIPRRVPVDVRVRVWVDTAGRVVRAAPAEKGTANDEFVKNALSAARQWRFAPAMANGRAVLGESVLTFHFKP